MNKKERIKEAVDFLIYKKIIINQEDLGKKMEKTKESISRALNGNEKYLTDKFLLSFCSTFDNIFNIDWLLTGEGDMLKREGLSIEQETRKPLSNDTIAMPREIFDLLSKQAETILSQQRTIESLTNKKDTVEAV